MKIFEAARAARPVDLRAKINLQAKKCCELEISSEYFAGDSIHDSKLANSQPNLRAEAHTTTFSPCLAKNQIRTVRV